MLALIGSPAELADLATASAYLKLPPHQRTEALRGVRAVLPSRVDVDATVQVSLARRVGRS